MASIDRLIDACATLMSDIGESALRDISAVVLDEYASLDATEQVEFFTHLADEYGLDSDKVTTAFTRWSTTRTTPNAESAAAEIALFDATEPRRQVLFRRINYAPGATLALTDMRADLRQHLREHPRLRPVDHDLHHLLQSWFNRGFLRMSEVTWDSPGELLDYLIRFEHVHPMQSLEDLRKRLAPSDRRMYAFFHPATGSRPLIFVEVALTIGVPDAIAPILHSETTLATESADTAVLYSINNALDGLAGISFGDLLIKQVIEEIGAALPHLHTFVTLSPLPRFRRWLARNDDYAELRHDLEKGFTTAYSAAWMDSMRPRVLSAMADYIALVRDSNDRPVDPVARFHLRNGAAADRLRWPADFSDKRMAESFGAMINYRYHPDHLERRHEDHVRHHRVAISSAIAEHLPAGDFASLAIDQ